MVGAGDQHRPPAMGARLQVLDRDQLAAPRDRRSAARAPGRSASPSGRWRAAAGLTRSETPERTRSSSGAPARFLEPTVAGEGDVDPAGGAGLQPQLEAAAVAGGDRRHRQRGEGTAGRVLDDPQLAAGDPGAVGAGQAAARGAPAPPKGTVSASPRPWPPRSRAKRRAFARAARRSGATVADRHLGAVGAQRAGGACCRPIGGVGAEDVGAGRQVGHRRDQVGDAGPPSPGGKLGRQLGPALGVGAADRRSCRRQARSPASLDVGLDKARDAVAGRTAKATLGRHVVEAQRQRHRGLRRLVAGLVAQPEPPASRRRRPGH